MIRFFAVGALATIGLLAGPAQAEMSVEAARAGVTPFYQALNAEFAKDSADLIRQATAPDWVSCRGNNVCNTRDEVIAAIGQRLKSIPDLKWEIKEVLVAGNQITVRGEATGTPAGEFMGTPHSGKSFKVMSIDVMSEKGQRRKNWIVTKNTSDEVSYKRPIRFIDIDGVRVTGNTQPISGPAPGVEVTNVCGAKVAGNVFGPGKQVLRNGPTCSAVLVVPTEPAIPGRS